METPYFDPCLTSNFYDGKTNKQIAYTTRSVANLSEMWHLKTKFLEAKRDPVYAVTNTSFHKDILSFLEKFTNIGSFRFWIRLSEEQKLNLSKAFTLVDERPLKLETDCEEDSANIFVVFSGTAVVSNNWTTDVQYCSLGKVFGATDVFDTALDTEADRDIYVYLKGGEGFADVKSSTNGFTPPLERGDKIENLKLSALLERGSVLKLTIHGYRASCLEFFGGIRDEDEDTPDDFELPPDSVLTDLDFVSIFARRTARRVLHRTIYSFLYSTDMLPRLASDPSNEYLYHGSYGRQFTIPVDSPPLVFMILVGSVKIQIDRNGRALSDEGRSREMNAGTIACVRRGNDSGNVLKIRKKSMPIATMEVGSLFTFNENCFKIGQPIEKKSDPIIRRRGDSTKQGLPSIRNKKQMKPKAPELYRISLIFDKATTMLMIPLKKMKQYLKDVDRTTSSVINSLLDYSNETMTARIEALLPWIKGTLVMNGSSYVGDEEIREEVPYSWTTHDFGDKGVNVTIDGDWDGNLCYGSTNRSFETESNTQTELMDNYCDASDTEVVTNGNNLRQDTVKDDDPKMAYIEAHMQTPENSTAFVTSYEKS